MEKKLMFKLVRPAGAKGGDRYEHGVKGDKDWIVIYVPQFISRDLGTPRVLLIITITD